MRDLDTIGEELFNKIRGRFPSVTIGNEEGKITNNPEEARFFDFSYEDTEGPRGKVSVNISEDEGLVVLFNSDLITKENDITRGEWYDFLKELRRFARKRALNFDTRDIERTNLKKRDYSYLAKDPGEDQMNESKMYGSSRVSYQDIGNARLRLNHNQSVNYDAPSGRTQHVEAIYIESAEGERFKYPFKHIAGARAMARHVAEGGVPHDDFGQHIVGLSEELANLKKFNTYMRRSTVMAEGLGEYMDVVRERVKTVKGRIDKLQRESYYREQFESFERSDLSEVPEDVQQDWIAQLTIKQFNEELKDVFPYIYKLIGEAGPKEVDFAAYAAEEDIIPSDSRVEEQTDEIEEAFNDMMGQFSEENDVIDHKAPGVKKLKNGSYWAKSQSGTMKIFDKEKDAKKHAASESTDMMGQFTEQVEDIEGFNIRVYKNIHQAWRDHHYYGYRVVVLPIKSRQILNRGQYLGPSPHDSKEVLKQLKASDPKLSFLNDKSEHGARLWRLESSMSTNDEKNIKAVAAKAKESADQETKTAQKKKGEEVKNTDNFGIVTAQPTDLTTKYQSKEDEEVSEKPQTPVTEYILSLFDRETGKFPKGETAVLTAIEKDYGEPYINPAKAFIERIYEVYSSHQQEDDLVDPDIETLSRIKGLAGL